MTDEDRRPGFPKSNPNCEFHFLYYGVATCNYHHPKHHKPCDMDRCPNITGSCTHPDGDGVCTPYECPEY